MVKSVDTLINAKAAVFFGEKEGFFVLSPREVISVRFAGNQTESSSLCESQSVNTISPGQSAILGTLHLQALVKP